MAEYYGVEPKYVGKNNADNEVSTSLVQANADGTLLERLEWVQVALGGAATQLRVLQSATGTVEEADIVRFAISLMDIDSGAIASASIDITGISATMARSRNGAAYAAISDPTVTFSKADGLVYMDYEFKAAQWQVGDMYRMTVSGITCTLHGDTAYVPAMVWCNTVQEAEDVTLNTQYLYGVADGGTTSPTKVVDNSILSILMTKDSGGDTSDFDNSTDSLEAQSDKLGAFTGDGGTDQGDSVKANQDIIISEIDHLYAVADGTGVYPASAVDDSIIAKVLGKGATASASTYDNQTDSLEMLSDKLGTFSGDGGANQDDSVKASLDLAHTELDTLITDTEKIYDVALGVAPIDGSLASFVATGGTALGTRLPVSTSLYDTVKNINTIGITGAPVANTLSDTLHKDGSFTYDNTTDSLEAASDKLGAFSGDGGAEQDDSIKASLDLAHTDLDALISKLATGVGQVQIVQTTESLDQAAASYDLFTGTTQAVILEGFSLKLPTGAVGGALTSVSVQTDDATPGVIISSTLGAVTNLTSEAEISWTGCLLVNVGTKIQLTIAGGAHGSAYTATFTAKYRAVTAGGTLA